MSCNCNNVKAPIITPVLAAGSVASPYYLSCNITQQLCYNACSDATPVFAPTFTLKQIVNTATNQYLAVIAVTGIISYVRCNSGGNSCSCCVQQPLSAEFTVPFASTTTPSVALSQGTTISALSVNACSSCSKTFVCDTPLTLTLTT